jgi:hypothetical protein
MTKEQVKEILGRVLTWPAKRQEDAARVLTEMEEQHTNPYRLTDEQLKRSGADARTLPRAESVMQPMGRWLHFGGNAVYESSISTLSTLDIEMLW